MGHFNAPRGRFIPAPPRKEDNHGGFAVDNRQMQTVTLSQADGRIILRESEGAFVEPEPNEA